MSLTTCRMDAGQRLGRERRARDERHRRPPLLEPDRELLERRVDLQVRRLADEAVVADVAHDADDLAPDLLRHAGPWPWNSNEIRFPIGSSFGNNFRTSASSTIATGDGIAVSWSVNERPRTSAMPIARK